MFRNTQFWLARVFFAVAGTFVMMVAAQAEGPIRDNVRPLSVLRAHMERVGAFDRGSEAYKKTSSVTTKQGKVSARRAELSKLVTKIAKKHGVPAALAKAVVTVESNYNPRARGGVGEVGLMQIRPATARGMGFRGTVKALYTPHVNLEWGMRYLAEARRRASGDLCGTILRYNAGHGARRMNPVSRRYCNKVKRILG